MRFDGNEEQNGKRNRGLPDVNASVRVVELQLSKVDTREELKNDLARKPRSLTATMVVASYR